MQRRQIALIGILAIIVAVIGMMFFVSRYNVFAASSHAYSEKGAVGFAGSQSNVTDTLLDKADHSGLVFASDSATTDEPSLALWLSNPTGSFNASGSISSLTSQASILAGNWSLSVSQGNITGFGANFTEIGIDGSNRHRHSIANFEMNVVAPVLLDRQGTTFTGESDITMDDRLAWSGVQTTVTIFRQDVIKMSFSGEETDNHFHARPIYGLMDSLQG